MFASGVQRLLDNVMRSLTAISLMTLSATMLMGIVGGTVMYVGARQILATPPTLTLGGWFAFVGYLAFLVAPMFQMVSHRYAVDGGSGGTRPDPGSAARTAGRRRPQACAQDGHDSGLRGRSTT